MRATRVLRVALRDVELHGWRAEITNDGSRLHLSGGSVTLDLGLSSTVMSYVNGRLHGYAVRVPTPTGSLIDLTVETERPATREAVNDAFARLADRGSLQGILDYTQDPIVSTDIVGSSYSSIFDGGLTAVIDHTQVKVVSWYDNEFGYSSRLVDLAERVLVPVAAAAGA